MSEDQTNVSTPVMTTLEAFGGLTITIAGLSDAPPGTYISISIQVPGGPETPDEDEGENAV